MSPPAYETSNKYSVQTGSSITMISSNILAIVHTSSLFLKKKCNTFTQSHAMKHSNRVRLPQTNPVAFQLSSHTILSLVLHQLSYKDTLKSLRLLMMQQRLSISHLLLLFDELTTLVAFKLALNYVMINKLISPRDRFAAAKISSLTLYRQRSYKLYIFCHAILKMRTILGSSS